MILLNVRLVRFKGILDRRNRMNPVGSCGELQFGARSVIRGKPRCVDHSETGSDRIITAYTPLLRILFACGRCLLPNVMHSVYNHVRHQLSTSMLGPLRLTHHQHLYLLTFSLEDVSFGQISFPLPPFLLLFPLLPPLSVPLHRFKVLNDVFSKISASAPLLKILLLLSALANSTY